MNKKLIEGFFLLAIALSISFISCTNKDKQQHIKEPVTLELSYSFNQDYNLLVSVKTNLPTETIMLFTLWDSEKTEIIADSDGKVENGKAVATLFSKNNLSDGKYALDIGLLLPFRQNENVRKIIGEHGEFLTGEFAKESFIPTEKTIEYTEYITINNSSYKSLNTQENDIILNEKFSCSDELQGKIDMPLLEDIIHNGFYENCKMLKQYPKAIESVNIYISKYDEATADKLKTYRHEDYDWNIEVAIDIKIRDDFSLIIDDENLAKQTLHFVLGGGKHPGIVTLDKNSSLFFGFDKSQLEQGSSHHIEVYGYEAIDSLVKEN